MTEQSYIALRNRFCDMLNDAAHVNADPLALLRRLIPQGETYDDLKAFIEPDMPNAELARVILHNA